MQVRYRAALRPEFYSVGCKGKEKIPLFPMGPLNFFLPIYFEIIGLNIALIILLQITSIVKTSTKDRFFPNCRPL